MYPTRIVLRPSQGHRVAKAAPSVCRGFSSGFFPPTPFWGATSRQSVSPYATHADLSPFFRMLDDTTRAFDNFPSFLNNDSARSKQQTWQPRFDVREVEGAYELRGELPGVESQALDVQFTDATTLVVSGRSESTRTEGQHLEAAGATESTVNTAGDGTSSQVEALAPEVDKSDAASIDSDSSYVRPSVEDDVPETASSLAGGNNATGDVSQVATSAAQTAAQAEASQQPKDTSTYWVSERRTGSFQRTFRFTQRVDQDGVTASLKNGILEILVPKAAIPEPRRVAVQ